MVLSERTLDMRVLAGVNPFQLTDPGAPIQDVHYASLFDAYLTSLLRDASPDVQVSFAASSTSSSAVYTAPGVTVSSSYIAGKEKITVEIADELLAQRIERLVSAFDALSQHKYRQREVPYPSGLTSRKTYSPPIDIMDTFHSADTTCALFKEQGREINGLHYRGWSPQFKKTVSLTFEFL
ncbi:MAG: hypothetical protein Q7R76_00350 [Candidatus Woesearchaeota archaeon]|nr:hypothetical protein [Candidatus Woesearchaeota archaeon]